MRGEAEKVAAVVDDAAGVGPVEARDDVEGGRLAGPVRADQSDDLAGVEREREVVEREDAAESARDLLEREEGQGPSLRLPAEVSKGLVLLLLDNFGAIIDKSISLGTRDRPRDRPVALLCENA